MVQSSIILEVNASMYDHSEEKLANLDFCLKLADLRFVIDL